MVAMATDHPLTEQEAVCPEQFRGETFLISRDPQGNEMHRFLSQRLRPLQPALNGVLLDLGPGALIARVAAGEGLALVCASDADRLGDGIVLRPVAHGNARFPVHALWKGEPDALLRELLRIMLAREPA